MSERLLIVRLGEWPQRSRRVWPRHSRIHDGALAGRKSAGAAFARAGGEWRCVRAVPGLESLLAMRMDEIREFLDGPARLFGWRYRWAARFEVP